jgi:hypothetical protein
MRQFSYAYDDAGRVSEASDAFSSYALSYEVVSDRPQVITDNAGTPGLPHVVLTTPTRRQPCCARCPQRYSRRASSAGGA